MAERERKPPARERGEEGFLSRWSRRKAEAREAEAREVEEREPADPAAAAPEQTEPEAIDPKDLPDIESLTKDSDFTVFMRKGVPEELRRQALRKLWRSDPVLANLDGLLEYGDDYSHIGRGGMSIKTAYQVGRGFVSRLEEIAPGDPAEPATTAAEPAEPPVPTPASEPAHLEAEPIPPAGAEPEVTPPVDDPSRGVQTSVRSRRRLPKRG